MIKFKEYITEVIHGPTKDYHMSHTEMEDFSKNISNHYDNHFAKASNETMESIRRYTSGSHKEINNLLNKGVKTFKSEYDHHLRTVTLLHIKSERENRINQQLDRYSGYVKNLQSSVTSHEAPHDFHVYTGIKFDPTEGKEHKEPFKAHIKQFTSATLKPEMAKSFTKLQEDQTNHLLKIHIPKGSKHGAYIAKHSTFEHEKEFLLKHGLKLKVHHEPEIHPGENGQHFKIWHATIED